MAIGYPVGGLLAAALAIPLIPALGWRVMYLIAAAPLVLVLPLALRYLPESLESLVARGRLDEARALADRLGVTLPSPAGRTADPPRGNGVGTLFVAPYAGSSVWLYVLVAVGGYGTIGTQTLLNAYITGYYPGSARAAGIGWALGVGRLGGILGPVLGGLLLSVGASLPVVFATFASVAIAGAAVVAAVRRKPSDSTDRGEPAALTPGSDRTVLD